jgi:hypothetical protein
LIVLSDRPLDRIRNVHNRPGFGIAQTPLGRSVAPLKGSCLADDESPVIGRLETDPVTAADPQFLPDTPRHRDLALAAELGGFHALLFNRKVRRVNAEKCGW